tara:strand:- start:2758 stop:2925 length:168 start_codon:yes stop_codon:yes gene_type:complete
MFEDLNWGAFLSVLKNTSKGSYEEDDFKKKDNEPLESEVRDAVDAILNQSLEKQH